jgi:RING finger protein 113A
MADSEGPVTFIKKRKGAPSGLRKKPVAATSSSADEPAAASEVVHAAKRNAASHLIQGTGNKRRKADDLAAADLSDSDEEKEKERQSYAVRHSSTKGAVRRRSESPPAWVSSEQVKEMARDKNAPPEEEVKDDGLYHGAKGEKHQLPKAFGPVKGGPANVRTITLVDYQPDVCKDYKGAFRSSLSPTSERC